MNMDLVIARDIKEDREQRCDDLPEYGSKRRSVTPIFGKPK